MHTRILTFSSLYPNSIQPNHGIFVEERMRNLSMFEGIEYAVIAPIPWCPFLSYFSEKYRAYSKIPKQEVWNKINVIHPRYLMIPKVGVVFQALSMALCSIFYVRKMNIKHDYDLLDAHYLYPDGVAAAIISKFLKMPMMLTARGTDVNIISQIWYLKYQIKWSTKVSSAITTVSQALAEKLKLLEVDVSKVNTIRNGVDMHKFNMPSTTDIKKTYSINGPLLISVGNLVDGKGHDLVVKAIKNIQEAHLLIIGEGEQKNNLINLITDLNLQERVSLVGRIEHYRMAEFYSAADVLILMSKREGMPNVVLESLACGTPVITTDVGGIKEIINSVDLGIVISERTTNALVEAVNTQLNKCANAKDIRQYAVETLSWKKSSKKLEALISNILVRT